MMKSMALLFPSDRMSSANGLGVSSENGGLEYDFIGEVPADLYCGICTKVCV